MIITHDQDAFESQLPPSTKSYTLKESPLAFKLLSDNLYKNKILAVIRELSCNAYDAHVAAGKAKTQFHLHLPTELDPIFRVEDFGVGLPPTGEGSVEELYVTYLESTKGGSNKFIGALGLGSKSPFAYTNNFTVKTRWNGEEHTFISCIDATYKPTITFVGSQKTEQCNGMTVEFAVKPSDFVHFERNAAECFKYWPIKPKLTGAVVRFANFREGPYSGRDWVLENGEGTAVAVMGNVPYPIRVDDANLTLTPSTEFVLNRRFILTFKLGELNFAPSREDLSYDGVTNKALVAAAERIAEDLKDQFMAQVNDSQNLSEFMRKLKDLTKSLSQVTGATVAEVVDFLTHALGSSKLKFKSCELSINELLTDRWYLLAGDKLVDNQLTLWGNPNTGRTKENATLVAATDDPNAIDQLSEYDVATWFSSRTITKEHPPRDAKLLSGKIKDWIDGKQKFSTFYRVSMVQKPIFVVNDMSGGASDKIRAYYRNAFQPIYVLSIDREKDSADALVTKLSAQLQALFNIEAPTVLKLSQLPDRRVKEEKVKEPRKPRSNITELVLEEIGTQKNVVDELFGRRLSAELKLVKRIETPRLVKYQETSGFYLIKAFGRIYYDEGRIHRFMSDHVQYLREVGALRPTDKIYVFAPRDLDRPKKHGFKSLLSLITQTLTDMTADQLRPFYEYERLSGVSIVESLGQLRRSYKSAYRMSNRKNELLHKYVEALKLISKYRKDVKKATPFSRVVSLLVDTRKEVKKAGTDLWRYAFFKDCGTKYAPQHPAHLELQKISADGINKKLLKAYPLLISLTWGNHCELVPNALSYIKMIDSK